MSVGRRVVVWAGVAFALCALSIACGPSGSAPAPTTPTADAFAVVRATSQAAYASGKALLDRGDLSGCIQIDTAKTNDPDNRADIQQALEQCLAAIALTPTPGATSAPAPASQRTIVVATVQAASAATPVPAAATTAAQPTTAPVSAGDLVPWSDPQGRFSVGRPSDWTRADQPQTLVGTGVVEFHDPSARAEVDVAVDTSTKAVSPELYAASLELTMEQQVAGYASEQIAPGMTAGSPSIRRVFTFTQRDSSGQEHQARGFQLTVVKGSTPYIISASAPAEMFQQYSPTFDRIVESFQFS